MRARSTAFATFIEFLRLCISSLPAALPYLYMLVALGLLYKSPPRAFVSTVLTVSAVFISISIAYSLIALGAKSFLRSLCESLDLVSKSISLALALLCTFGVPLVVLHVGIVIALRGGLASFSIIASYVSKEMLYASTASVFVATILTISKIAKRVTKIFTAMYLLAIAIGIALSLHATVTSLTSTRLSIGADLTRVATGTLCSLMVGSVTIIVSIALLASTLRPEAAVDTRSGNR